MHSYNILEKGSSIRNATKALILLHGRGATASSILNLADEFCDDRFYIAAPQATDNSWYPHNFMSPEKSNDPWVTSSVKIVNRLIDEISFSIPIEQIYIMGFSQGACLALEASARNATRYGGVVAFTGGLIGPTLNEDKYHGNFEGTKIFIGTGDSDPHVPLERAEDSRDLLAKMGARVTLKVYPRMGHTIIDDELIWVKANIFG